MVLGGNEFGNAGICVFSDEAPINIQYLYVDSTKFDQTAFQQCLLSYFKKNIWIRGLSIGGNPLGNSGLRAITEAVSSSIEELFLDYSGAGGDELISVVNNLQNHTSLKILSISGNQFGTITNTSLPLVFPKSVEQIHIRDSAFTSESTARFARAISGLNRLALLEIQGNPEMKNAGVIALIKDLPHRVEQLWLGNTGMTAEGFSEVIKESYRLVNLRMLNVANNKISGFSFDFQMTQRQINFLDLNGCQVTGADVRSLMPLLKQTPGQVLTLHNNKIDNDGAAAFAKYLQPCIIRGYPLWIDLLHTQPPYLIPSSSLTTLALQDNNISNSGEEAFCRLIPFTDLSEIITDPGEHTTVGIFLTGNPITTSQKDCFSVSQKINYEQFPPCPVVSSAASRPEPALLLPYTAITSLLAKFYNGMSDLKPECKTKNSIIECCAVLLTESA